MQRIRFFHLVSSDYVFKILTFISPLLPVKFSDLDKSLTKRKGLFNHIATRVFIPQEQITKQTKNNNKTIHTDANVINMHAKYQLHTPYVFQQEDL